MGDGVDLWPQQVRMALPCWGIRGDVGVQARVDGGFHRLQNTLAAHGIDLEVNRPKRFRKVTRRQAAHNLARKFGVEST